MRLSNVLLAAMFTSVYGALAQEATTVTSIDTVKESNIMERPFEISIDSALLKKIDSLYANRNKLPNTIQKKHTANGQSAVRDIGTPKVTKRPSFNCPGCGRG